MTTPRCESCRHYAAPDTEDPHPGLCRRFPRPEPIAAPASHYCGEFRDRLYIDNSAPEKVSDHELFEAIRYFPGQVVPWKTGLDALSAQFGVARRTLEERVKRLDWLQKVEIVRAGNGRIDSVMAHLSMVDWQGWVDSCAQFGGNSKVRWKEMEEAGTLLPGAMRPMRSNAKWEYEAHLLPAMQSLAPDEEHAQKFSKIANLAFTLCEINRAAFARLMREAVERGAVVQTKAGWYYLKGA